MTFDLIPNITFIIAVSGIIALVSRRLPEAKKALQHEQSEAENSTLSRAQVFALKLPGHVWSRLGYWVKRLWHFLLEAKDIKKPAAVGYRIKKMLPKKKARTAENFVEDGLESKDEQYYLRLIQDNPKDLENYSQLGKFYTAAKRFEDAKDMYQYLVKRDPGNAQYYAKLAFADFKLSLYSEAVTNYEKSLALDSAQPNRYYNLALALDAIGKTEQAVVPIQRALELEPENKKYRELYEALQGKSEDAK